MPGEDLQRLVTQFQNEYQHTQEHLDLIEAVKAVNDYTQSLRRPDRYGRLPLVTESHKNQLRKLHRKVAKLSDALIKGPDSDELKGMVKKISSLASANYRSLAAYDPSKEQKSLATIEEETRTVTLDLSNAPAPETVGQNLSSRQVVSFLDNKGNPVTGLFTPKTEINVVETLTNAVDEIAGKAKTEKGRKLLQNLFENYRVSEGFREDQLNLARAAFIDECRKTVQDEYGADVQSMKEVDPQLIAKTIAKSSGEAGMTADDVINEIGAENLAELADRFGPQIANSGLIMVNAGIPDGSRIDSRNSAMSSVADLLGVPEVIARARPMKIIDKNGQEIEGTFMESVEGLDFNNPSADADGIDANSLVGTDGSGLKSLADLQVVDYLCGNIDRHPGNMIYKFNENQKLIDVKGIDNDCALGTKVPVKRAQNHLAPPSNMLAVSESMYNKVIALTPEELKYSLRGFGLSEEELDAAGKRLKVLQDELEKGKAHYDALDENLKYDRKYQMEIDHDIVAGAAQQGGIDDSFEFSKPDLEGEREGEEAGEKEPEKKEPEQKEPERKAPAEEKEEFHTQAFRMEHGYTRVVKDDQFYRFTPKHIAAEDNLGNKENIFSNAKYAIDTVSQRKMRLGKEYKKLQAKVTVGGDNRCLPAEQKKSRQQADAVVELLDKNSKFARSSGNYRDVERAAKAYAKFQKKLQERLEMANRENLKKKKDYRLDVEAVVGPEDLKKMKELSEKLVAAGNKYLNGKFKNGKTMDDYSDYTKTRINGVRNVVEQAQKNAVIKPYEKDAAEVNSRQAQERLSRRLGDIAEAKDLKKHKPAKKMSKEPAKDTGENKAKEQPKGPGLG